MHNPTIAITNNIVFLKMLLSHIAGKESLLENSVQRIRFSAKNPRLLEA